jgi:Leucine-rich repeat (LRR) protein
MKALVKVALAILLLFVSLFPTTIAATPVRAESNGAIIVTVDGLDFDNFLGAGFILKDRPEYLEPALVSMNIPNSEIYPFVWDHYSGNTKEWLPLLRAKLREKYDEAIDTQKKFIVVSHSWGAFLTLCALSDLKMDSKPVIPDLYITLSCPTGSDALEIASYVGGWMAILGQDKDHSWIGSPQTVRHLNWWAQGDIISGPLVNLLGNEVEDFEIPNAPRSFWDLGYSSTMKWHAYTGLSENWGEPPQPTNNQELIDDVRAEIIQTLNSPPTIQPGGVWINPDNGATVTNSLHFEARAYPSNTGDPPIDHVNFTAWWPALGPENDPWYVVNTVYVPTYGDVYEYNWDLAGVPAGEIKISFDVFDVDGNKNLAPNGIRTINYNPTTVIVAFPDPNLEAAIRNAINKPTSDIYQSDLIPLTSFYGNLSGITNLSGLEYCTNLKFLYLSDNQINNISPLQSLTNLELLYLDNNQISDISALQNLTNLQYLYLINNQINDISALQNLTNLKYLFLWKNQITNISALQNLINLQQLNFGNNQVSDISALQNLTSLQQLGSENNQINDISALQNLTSLQYLDLNNNQISDISSLVANLGLGAGDGIDLRVNQLDIAPGSPDMNNISALIERGARVYYSPQKSIVVTFPDPNLEAAIRDATGKPTGDIYQSNLLDLTSLDANIKNISNLSGLEYCVNLTWLSIFGNQITDISPLASLTNITYLQLWGNQICDVSPLASLNQLTWLGLGYNQITDISSLSSLTSINNIYVDHNSVVDLSPLSSLINLYSIDMGRNQISNVSPLQYLVNLRSISLGENQIIDIAPMQNLTNLNYLYLNDNQITDISSLQNLTNLVELNLNKNQITDISPLLVNLGLGAGDIIDLQYNNLDIIAGSQDMNDIQALIDRGATLTYDPQNPIIVTFPDSNLETAIRDVISKPTGDIYASDLFSLTYLDCGYKNIINLSGLEYCTNLQTLNLGSNKISDISALQNLTNLYNLYLYNNQISDITPLQYLINLNGLFLSDNQITDISPLQNLTNLTGLSLSNNQINNIIPLQNLTLLGSLTLSNNHIGDISPLQNLTQLFQLELDNNQIVDVSPLQTLSNLDWLFLNSNHIVDITPLQSLTSLICLYLNNNQIIDTTPLQNLTSLHILYLNNNCINSISLANLTSLTDLYLENNQIIDISLANLTSLTGLYLDNNLITNVSFINLNSLSQLQLNNNLLVDLSPLQNLTSLTNLSLGSNQIVDVSFLYNLTSLYWLNLNNNQIIDISPLVDNPGVDSGDMVFLAENPLSDHSIDVDIPALVSRGVVVSYDYGSIVSFPDANLEAVIRQLIYKPTGEIYEGNLQTLTNLLCVGQDITNLTGLEHCVNLTWLFLDDNQITDISALQNLTNLQGLGLSNNRLSYIHDLVLNSGIDAGDWVFLDNNKLNTNPGSQDMTDIQALTDRGVIVSYSGQNPSILQTNLTNVALSGADATISGVTVISTPNPSLDVPAGFTSSAAYVVDATGSGEFTLVFTVADAANTLIYKINPLDATDWILLNPVISGDTLTLTMQAGDPVLVFGTGTGTQTWYLDSETTWPDGTDLPTGFCEMEKTPGPDADGQSGVMDVSFPARVTWLSDEPALTEVAFSGDWNIKLFTTVDWTGICTVQVGECEANGSNFNVFGTAQGEPVGGIITLSVNGIGTVPAGHYLALKVSGDGTGSVITDGSSYLASPFGDPGYPLPEIATGILLGLGLSGLIACLYIKRKNLIMSLETNINQ